MLGHAIGIIGGIAMTSEFYKDFSSVFKESKQMAKQTGRMLAAALACGYPFKNQTISFIGFSLGCQVIKSCLKALDQVKARHIVHEVTFLGGAVDTFDKAKHRN